MGREPEEKGIENWVILFKIILKPSLVDFICFFVFFLARGSDQCDIFFVCIWGDDITAGQRNRALSTNSCKRIVEGAGFDRF